MPCCPAIPTKDASATWFSRLLRYGWTSLALAGALAAGLDVAAAKSVPVVAEVPNAAEAPSDGPVEGEASARDQLALVFIGYTSAKLCADAGEAFSAPEIGRIEKEVTKASAASGFTQAEQDTLWLDVLNSMASSKGAVTEESCTEDKAMLRFQMPQVWANQPAEGSASGL